MTRSQYPKDWPDIDTALYDRSVKLFQLVENVLGVKIKLHADSQPEQGDIFLFNHFSRFETFIPQFLIHERTGAYSCAIASGEFFREDTSLSRYLKQVGVFPSDHPRLLPLLAAQLLRGRKVIVFPEGGMVKDHRVMDREGRFSVYSRITGERRKQHTGPAVLAQGLEAFKTTIRNAYADKNLNQLNCWRESLQLDSLEQLLAAALKPTLIVPANITFYPIRSSENLLRQVVELFSDELTPRQTEELLIEGNILLKDTDMDVRMGQPVNPCMVWHWWNRYLLRMFSSDFMSLDDVFALPSRAGGLRRRLLGCYFRRCARATRNLYMVDIYSNLTVNLSHLASSLIVTCLEAGQRQIAKERFYTALYLAIRRLQQNRRIHLHRSLLNPSEYMDMVEGKSRRFEHFLCLAKQDGLIMEEANHYRFADKLCADYDLDTIRLQNPIAVYNNEVAPIPAVRASLKEALERLDSISPRAFAALRFEDELAALARERETYVEPRFDDINRKETADADPRPFLLEPGQSNGVGILLSHGLFASPAEVRGYGKHLCEQSYTVLGVRLPGHGTSPYALRDQSWEDWYASLRRGLRMLLAYCPRVVVIGFSTGGALALKLTSEARQEILGVVALSVPITFMNPAFMLIPLLYGTNQLISWISDFEGVKSFIENTPEHPRINYRNTPVRALYELRRLIHAVDEFAPKVAAPTLILYAEHDPIVAPKSAETLTGKLTATEPRLVKIAADRHGILMENLAGTWQVIDRFIADIASASPHAVIPGSARAPGSHSQPERISEEVGS